MRLIFRADASVDQGSGHVMRISAIAEEAISRGIDCVFVGSISGVDWLSERITSLKFSKICDEMSYIPNSETDILILDSYKISLENTFIQPRFWKKIVSIVDEATPAYASNLELHPGFDASWHHETNVKFLYGGKYFPLRKSISRREPPEDRPVSKILVFGGGTDPFGFADEFSKLLAIFPGNFKAVIIGPETRDLPRLDERFVRIKFGESLDKEIENTDLVFTTASTSSLEVVARGIPLGIACAVENQRNMYRELKNMGVAAPIGLLDAMSNWQFDNQSITKLLEDPKYRQNLVSKGEHLIDLNGSSRLIDSVLELVISNH